MTMHLQHRESGKLYQQLAAKLPQGMEIPQPLKKLYEWIEREGNYYDNEEGMRVGHLYPPAEHKKSNKNQREGGTYISFLARKNDFLGYWFGFTDKRTGMDVSGGRGQKVLDRLCVFANTGGEGSMAAFWLGDDGKQRIVHLGSGSGSILVCVLAKDAVDFLRLLAIGYGEMCWNEEYAKPPNSDLKPGNIFVNPNLKYRKWVEETFGVTIPKTALEIVQHPSEMGDENSDDPFFQWTKKWGM